MSSTTNAALVLRSFQVFPLVIWAIAMIATDSRPLQAEPQTRDVVGLGATTCQQFAKDIGANPQIRMDYLAWAQGFMSGILLSRPTGVDAGLNLTPPTFGLISQLDFLQDYCAQHSSANFGDAVEALYKRLRQEGRT